MVRNSIRFLSICVTLLPIENGVGYLVAFPLDDTPPLFTAFILRMETAGGSRHKRRWP